MYKSNLLEIFKKFSPKEIKEFEDFISSPYYNKNKNVVSLFSLIKTEYPDFTKGNLIKEKVYKKIYAGAKYNDGTIRLLMFYLQELSEKFLGVKNFEADEFASSTHLLKELNLRDLHKNFEKDYKGIEKNIAKIKKQDFSYFHGKFLIEYEYLSHFGKMYFERDEKFVGKVTISKIFENLTCSYLIRIFKFYLYHINIRLKFNVNDEYKLFEELIYRHNTEDYKDVPVLNMYYYCLMMVLKPGDEQFYFKAKELLFENEDTFTDDDKIEFYIGLENFCKRKYKTGKTEYVEELFQINLAQINKKAYMFHGVMPELFYKSAADIGLQLKKYDWAKKFIQDYKKELPEQFRENTYLHCMGVYEFAVDNFEKSLEYISKVKFDEIYQKLDIKCLLNAIYYELKIFPSLESSIDTFRHFLKNDKIIPAERKEPFSVFNKNLSKLLKLQRKPDMEELELFHDNIKAGMYYNKQWFLGKIAQLMELNKT